MKLNIDSKCTVTMATIKYLLSLCLVQYTSCVQDNKACHIPTYIFTSRLSGKQTYRCSENFNSWLLLTYGNKRGKQSLGPRKASSFSTILNVSCTVHDCTVLYQCKLNSNLEENVDKAPNLFDNYPI